METKNNQEEKATLKIRLKASLKNEFERHCKAKGISLSSALRDFMASQIKHKIEPQEDNQIESRWKLVNTRLTSSEYKGMAVHVQAEKTTNSKWLQRLIREKVINAPQLRNEEIQCIEQAMFKVQSVGRNLNQLVKHLNSPRHEFLDMPNFDAQECKAVIDETADLIKGMIKNSTQRDFEYE